MIHFSDLDLDPSPKRLRTFGFIGAVILAVFAAMSFLRGSHHAAMFAFVGVVLVAIVAAVAPRGLRLAWRVLTIATFPIGWLVSRLLLALLFFLVLTPIALVLRVARKGPHVHGFAPEADTYWIDTSREKSSESYLEQF
jgi:hypothetical protein